MFTGGLHISSRLWDYKPVSVGGSIANKIHSVWMMSATWCYYMSVNTITLMVSMAKQRDSHWISMGNMEQNQMINYK